MKQSIKIPTVDIKRYGGKQIAIADGKIIAVGKTLEEVVRRARSRTPSKPLNEIQIFSVPKTLAAIYYA